MFGWQTRLSWMLHDSLLAWAFTAFCPELVSFSGPFMGFRLEPLDSWACAVVLCSFLEQNFWLNWIYEYPFGRDVEETDFWTNTEFNKSIFYVVKNSGCLLFWLYEARHVSIYPLTKICVICKTRISFNTHLLFLLWSPIFMSKICALRKTWGFKHQIVMIRCCVSVNWVACGRCYTGSLLFLKNFQKFWWKFS